MTREEVISKLEELLEYSRYNDSVGWNPDNDTETLEDTLALLREQGPVAPVLQSGGNYVCGNCRMYTVGFLNPLTGESVQTWKYCGSCGKKVRWDG